MTSRSFVLAAALALAMTAVPRLAIADEPGPAALVESLAAAAQPVAEPAPEPQVAPTPTPPALPSTAVRVALAPASPERDTEPTLRADTLEWPFGYSQPALTCAPLQACDIELQAGEVIHGVALGDTERWLASPLTSGDADHLVPHVVVKPKEWGLATNLLIATTRRTYHISLVAPEKGRGGAYTRRLTFRYPDELVQIWTATEDLKKAAAEREAMRVEAPLEAPALTDLHFGYKLVLPRGAKPAWTPVRVFDDGHRTYVQMPEALPATDAPALFAVDAGQAALVNYRVSPNGHWWIADGVYDSLRLLLGSGRSQRAVSVLRTN